MAKEANKSIKVLGVVVFTHRPIELDGSHHSHATGQKMWETLASSFTLSLFTPLSASPLAPVDRRRRAARPGVQIRPSPPPEESMPPDPAITATRGVVAAKPRRHQDTSSPLPLRRAVSVCAAGPDLGLASPDQPV